MLTPAGLLNTSCHSGSALLTSQVKEWRIERRQAILPLQLARRRYGVVPACLAQRGQWHH
jgi:hypothetical protein